MNLPRIPTLAALFLPFLLCCCGSKPPVLELRSIQTKFDAATHGDNLAPEGTGMGTSAYQDVVGSLTDAYIDALPPELQATAWMMRGVSEWRLGSFNLAGNSAESGLQAGPKPHSRDQIMLQMLPGLIIDSDIVSQWKAGGKAYDATKYADVERQYVTAFKQVSSAENAIRAATDESVKNYLAYHKWRMLYNWQTIIDNLTGGPAVVDAAIESSSRHFGGKDLLEVAYAARDSIPAGDRLRELIRAKTGR